MNPSFGRVRKKVSIISIPEFVPDSYDNENVATSGGIVGEKISSSAGGGGTRIEFDFDDFEEQIMRKSSSFQSLLTVPIPLILSPDNLKIFNPAQFAAAASSSIELSFGWCLLHFIITSSLSF
ncbi:unnamed protein product [Caenorhabditis nigoni]